MIWISAQTIKRIFGWMQKVEEDRTLLLTLARKLQLVVDHRAMGSKTLKLSALMASAIVKYKADPTACDLCVVIAELEKQRVDFVTIGVAYKCLRDAVGKNKIGDESLLRTQVNLDIMQKAMSVEESHHDFISAAGVPNASRMEVEEVSYAEFANALNHERNKS